MVKANLGTGLTEDVIIGFFLHKLNAYCLSVYFQVYLYFTRLRKKKVARTGHGDEEIFVDFFLLWALAFIFLFMKA